MPSKLFFVNGEALNVLQSAEDAALLLWGRKKGDDAHDKGYATLQGEHHAVHVNPAAVAYVTPIVVEGLDDRSAIPSIE